MQSETTRRILEYHASMLADVERTEGLRRAIHEVVRPGDVVVDIGAGTGILSLFAREAGASRVFAVERGPVASLAERVIAANGAADVVELVRATSYELVLERRADVVVTETLWNLGVGEGIVEIARDALARLATADGRLIPRGFTVWAAPVARSRSRRAIDLWSSSPYGLDLSPLREPAVACVHVEQFEPGDLLAEGRPVVAVDLCASRGGERTGAASFTLARSGDLHGLAAWFDAELAPGHRLTNAPPNRAPSWHHGLLPLERPIAVRSGDELGVEVRLSADGEHIGWSVELNGERVGGQSTLAAQLASLAELRRGAPGHRPARSRAGEAAAVLLAAMDGTTPMSRLLDDLQAGFPDVLPSRARAEAFVREVVERFS